MSVVAICGGVAMYFMLRSYLLVNEGPPLLRHIKGQRIFEQRACHRLVAARKMVGESSWARGACSRNCSCWSAPRCWSASLRSTRAELGPKAPRQQHSISCSEWSGLSGSLALWRRPTKPSSIALRRSSCSAAPV